MHADYQKINFLINYNNFKYRDYYMHFSSINKTIFERYKAFDFFGKKHRHRLSK